ncbi:MAG: serine/threonine-protein kinase [Planctomycetota bacterium]
MTRSRSESNCTRCGSPLPVDASECARCLLEAAIAVEPRAAPSAAPRAAAEATSERARAIPTLDEVRAAFPDLEIEALLGSGGMGVVFKARQPKLARTVALKVLAPPNGAETGFAERFLREARTLARLSHPGIVAVHDFGCAAGLHFLIMEYVDGVDLRRLLREGPLAPRQALAIARELCDALQFAHDEGVVHRDIKPENVLIDARGRVKVADFGLAKLVDAAADAALTRSDQVMGTPHYMAPEQLERPLDVDHRADIFALGVVLYEMLTGSLPRGKFELPSRRVHVDVKLDEIVLRALEREPERRYQHALEVKTDVDLVPLQASRAGGAIPTAREEPRREKRDPLRGARVVPAFMSVWIVVAVAWNLGAFALGVAVVLAAAACLALLRARLLDRPELAQRLALLTPRARRVHAAGACVIFVIGVGLVVLGHVLHWERGGGKLWLARHVDGTTALSALRNDPWSVLRLGIDATRTPPIESVVGGEAHPVVALERFEQHGSFTPPSVVPWIVIAGGLAVLCVGFAGAASRRADVKLRAAGWHIGLELASYALGGLVVLWIGAPLVALKTRPTLDSVRLDIVSDLRAEAAFDALARALEDEGSDEVFDARFALRDERTGVRWTGGRLACFARSSPFENWATSLAGPRRIAPRLWITAVELVGGNTGTRVMLDAGLYPSGSVEQDGVRALLERLADRL